MWKRSSQDPADNEKISSKMSESLKRAEIMSSRISMGHGYPRPGERNVMLGATMTKDAADESLALERELDKGRPFFKSPLVVSGVGAVPIAQGASPGTAAAGSHRPPSIMEAGQSKKTKGKFSFEQSKIATRTPGGSSALEMISATDEERTPSPVLPIPLTKPTRVGADTIRLSSATEMPIPRENELFDAKKELSELNKVLESLRPRSSTKPPQSSTPKQKASTLDAAFPAGPTEHNKPSGAVRRPPEPLPMRKTEAMSQLGMSMPSYARVVSRLSAKYAPAPSPLMLASSPA